MANPPGLKAEGLMTEIGIWPEYMTATRGWGPTHERSGLAVGTYARPPPSGTVPARI